MRLKCLDESLSSRVFPNSRYLKALCSVNECLIHKYTLILVCFERYSFRLVPCEIGGWFGHLGFEGLGKPIQKAAVGNRKISKKSGRFQTPPCSLLLTCIAPSSHLIHTMTNLFLIRQVSSSPLGLEPWPFM